MKNLLFFFVAAICIIFIKNIIWKGIFVLVAGYFFYRICYNLADFVLVKIFRVKSRRLN